LKEITHAHPLQKPAWKHGVSAVLTGLSRHTAQMGVPSLSGVDVARDGDDVRGGDDDSRSAVAGRTLISAAAGVGAVPNGVAAGGAMAGGTPAGTGPGNTGVRGDIGRGDDAFEDIE